jgi:hypothetical protein
MSDIIRKLTLVDALREIEERRDEYLKWLEFKIRAHDAAYRASDLAYKTQPMRHPKGQSFPHHDRKYLWNDAIWCQDITTTWPEEFLCIESLLPPTEGDDTEWYKLNEAWQETCNELFDIAWRKVMPKSYHSILEG